MRKSLPDSHIQTIWHQFMRAVLVVLLIFATSLVVYFTGGTAAAFTHLMYIPVILSAFYFGVNGAAAAAFAGGLALGPLMPEDVGLGLMQQPVGWMLRLVFLAAIGTTFALLYQRIKSCRVSEVARLYQDTLTGLPNINQLRLDLENLIDHRVEFSMIGFRVVNLDDINRFIGYEIGVQSVKKATSLLSDYTDGMVYSIFTNEFAAVLPGRSMEDAKKIGARFLKELYEPLSVGRFSIGLALKGGLVNFPHQAEKPDDLIRKMGMTLSQKTNEIGLYVFDPAIEQKNRERAKLVAALFETMNNGGLQLVYQPILEARDCRVGKAEALLRWNRGLEKQIKTEEMIRIAEETGVISEITKWVIKSVVDQVGKWKDEGISIKVALNISPKDLRDGSVIQYFMETIKKSNLEPSMMEIELTERGILENKNHVMQLFHMLREQGVKISLDDFGTGYNTLVDLIQIPIDCLKIDKVFVDGLPKDANRVMIAYMVSFAHQTGRKVTAEGVESREQFDLLKKMGCDFIQGYYFSKPLPPDQLKNFILQRSVTNEK